MKAIAILGHWSTGSSVLAHTLKNCGMNVGNEMTFWDEYSVDPCEHSQLNAIGIQFYRGNYNSDYIEKARQIIRSYPLQAAENEWKFYGFKVTHVLQENCWKIFKEMFSSYWPNAQYVIPIRHPLSIAKTVLATNDPDWPEEKIVESFVSTKGAIEDLGSEAMFVRFPDHFEEDVAAIVSKLKMKSGQSEFSRSRIDNGITEDEEARFANKYPEAMDLYNSIVAVKKETKKLRRAKK